MTETLNEIATFVKDNADVVRNNFYDLYAGTVSIHYRKFLQLNSLFIVKDNKVISSVTWRCTDVDEEDYAHFMEAYHEVF